MSPASLRQPAHESITPEQISLLVDRFYDRVRSDRELSPLFVRHMSRDWPGHLSSMKAFWRSVLLRTGEYKGKPVPAHARMQDVSTENFVRWLELFGATVREVFAPPAQPVVIAAAERIATSLWLAMKADPFSTPPIWPDTR
uniref:group III truncated hemoglobin n=1 Tax=Pararhizobium sp. IMCC3301 TaxID=3067904 RepID=UPI00274284CA|nr:group III truncated hemoglobin [Pararhizobium sp. IMCC3301]